jgi:hypothetical protein
MKLEFSWQILEKYSKSSRILNKLEFSQRIFKKNLNNKIHEGGNRVVHSNGQTGRRLSQYYESA